MSTLKSPAIIQTQPYVGKEDLSVVQLLANCEQCQVKKWGVGLGLKQGCLMADVDVGD